jgi:pilus assembly protein Flp/PilA
MLQYMRRIAARRREDDGAASVEYGLLVAAIAAIIVLVVFAIGTWVKGAFDTTCSNLDKGPTGSTINCDPGPATT